MKKFSALSLAILLSLGLHAAQAQTPVGEVKGTATAHTEASAKGVMAGAQLVLPTQATAGAVYVGAFKDAPATARNKVPVVVFLHGSSGLGLKAIGEWQQWLGSLGIASVAPDSFALPDRVTYKSPASKEVYEKIHALRRSEITLALQALQTPPWADMQRLVLAGTSEGATAVACYGGTEFAGRIIFSWSCEDNYFVERPDTAVVPGQQVLNIISSTDPFFSKSNSWLGNSGAAGHCGAALKGNAAASVVLIPDAPHTLLNFNAARNATAGFLAQVVKP